MLAGIWRFDRGGPAAAISFDVRGDGSLSGRLLDNHLNMTGLTEPGPSSTSITGYRDLGSYQAGIGDWRIDILGRHDGRLEARFTPTGKQPVMLVLRRWREDEIAVPPERALHSALEVWRNAGHTPALAEVEMTEMLDEMVTGKAGGRREWWVRLPQPPDPKPPVGVPEIHISSRLTIAVNEATGETRGPFGR